MTPPSAGQAPVKVLDHGYLGLIESWGSDQGIVEAARMSTQKGFLGWGPHGHKCVRCGEEHRPFALPSPEQCRKCGLRIAMSRIDGDEKLLRYLYEHKHSTPFEMAGMTIEVQAPIFVFREWHRHRTQCLGPDTLLHFDAPKSRENRRFVYKMRIEDAWKKWQPTTRVARPERQTNSLWPRSRIQAMQLRCLDEEEREIGHTKIMDVIRGEPKHMIRVTTTSGSSLVATRAHKVLTSIGWKTLGEAVDEGCTLTLEGTTRAKARSWEIPTLMTYSEEWKAVVGWESIYEVSSYGRVRRIGSDPKKIQTGAHGYLVTSLNRPGEQVLRTVHSMVLEAFVGPKCVGQEARHANHNRADSRLLNLSWGSARENKDDMQADDRHQRLVAVFEDIVEVKAVGKQPTYDLSVEGPYHNFVADSFVVHNSYSEMSARYEPLPDVNYIPSVERLMMNVSKGNKQAGTIKDSEELTIDGAEGFQSMISESYVDSEQTYQWALKIGVPKELARIHLPVGRYSRMRASANLRNWLAFLTLRLDPAAQWEIRQYAEQVGVLIASSFPRTWELFVADGKSR